MPAIDTNLWPLVMAGLFLTIAAWCQWRIRRIPNLLCGSFLLAAAVVAVLIDAGSVPGYGGWLSTLVGTLVGFLAMIPFYARLRLGAGCVKSQAVFGSWVGCAVSTATCWRIVAVASLLACLVTAASAYMAWNDRCEDYESRLDVFPAQITLSLGSLFASVIMTWMWV